METPKKPAPAPAPAARTAEEDAAWLEKMASDPDFYGSGFGSAVDVDRLHAIAERLASPAPLLAGVTSDDTWGCADCGLIANRPVACDCDTAKPRTEGTDGALAEAVAELRAWSRHDRTVFAGVPASVPTAIRLVLSALAQAQADLAAARRTS